MLPIRVTRINVPKTTTARKGKMQALNEEARFERAGILI
jgi:hypothetical protein